MSLPSHMQPIKVTLTNRHKPNYWLLPEELLLPDSAKRNWGHLLPSQDAFQTRKVYIHVCSHVCAGDKGPSNTSRTSNGYIFGLCFQVTKSTFSACPYRITQVAGSSEVCRRGCSDLPAAHCFSLTAEAPLTINCTSTSCFFLILLKIDHPETVKPCDTGCFCDFLQFNWFNERI